MTVLFAAVQESGFGTSQRGNGREGRPVTARKRTLALSRSL
jgi:hypothetical protein